MQTGKILTTVTLAAMLTLVQLPARAQVPTCDEIQFTGRVLSGFPQANDYCLEVVEKDGEQYAHFQGEYVRHSGQEVTLRFKNTAGGYHDPVTVRAPEGQRIKIGGRDLRIRDLQRGDELDIYVPQDRWVAIFHDTHEEFVADADVEEYEIVPAAATMTAATLPATASPVPLLGLLGGLFTALGLVGFAFSRSRRD